jgi:predicted RNA-binding Zn-ribbon protein involved in translation (DUF1610 family)
MAESYLVCAGCGNKVEQSQCLSCRRKIHDYKCPRCGNLVPNPEYGKK